MAYKPYRGFSWNISSYYPLALQETHSEKELRNEYARLRSVAQKSIHRLGKSEFAESQTYRQNVDRFMPTAKLKSKQDVARALTDVTRFLSAKGHNVSGLKEIRKEAIATWHSKGYNWVNVKNYENWTRFLAWYKELKGFKYDIDEAIRQFQNTSAEEMEKIRQHTLHNFKYYVENLDER